MFRGGLSSLPAAALQPLPRPVDIDAPARCDVQTGFLRADGPFWPGGGQVGLPPDPERWPAYQQLAGRGREVWRPPSRTHRRGSGATARQVDQSSDS